MKKIILLATLLGVPVILPHQAAAGDGLYKKTGMDAGSASIYARERARIAARRDRSKYRDTKSGCGVNIGVVKQKPGSNNRGDIEINAIATGPVISYCAR